MPRKRSMNIWWKKVKRCEGRGKGVVRRPLPPSRRPLIAAVKVGHMLLPSLSSSDPCAGDAKKALSQSCNGHVIAKYPSFRLLRSLFPLSDASNGSEARVLSCVLSLLLPEVLLEEVDADGLLVVVGEDAAAVTLDHARLAHRPVPHDHHLKGRNEIG